MNALSTYCQTRLGLNVEDMSEDELRQFASAIIRTMAKEIGLIGQVVAKGRQEVAKAAQEYGKLIPYEVIRDEKVPSFDEVDRSSNSDPNSILDSLFVFPDPE